MRSSFVFSLAGVATLGLAALYPAEGRDGPLKKLLNSRRSQVATAQEQSQTSNKTEVSTPNTLSSNEKSLGFELLFNGKDYQGWDNKGNWIVEDGAIARKDKGGGITFTAKK
ncbi:MAG: family 16 glycoside hydrolase, partial [Planctomycetia bacterium]